MAQIVRDVTFKTYVLEQQADGANRLAEAFNEKHDKTRMQWKALVFSLSLIVLLVGLIGGMMAIVSEATKESRVKKATAGALMVSADGTQDIVQTADALVAVPLLVAPVLPKHLKLDTVSVSYMVTTGEGLNLTATTVKESFKVGSTRWVNDTYMTIVKSRDESPTGAVEVRIWNGMTEVLLKDGSTQFVCHGDTDCSALKVAGQAEATALEEKALDALQNHGIIDAEDRKEYYQEQKEDTHRKLMENIAAHGRALREGRRLLWDFGCCSGGLANPFSKGDGADCNTNNVGIRSGKAGYQLSQACRTHDSCLLGCNGNCGCRGNWYVSGMK